MLFMYIYFSPPIQRPINNNHITPHRLKHTLRKTDSNKQEKIEKKHVHFRE
jgi:hypothetical protein